MRHHVGHGYFFLYCFCFSGNVVRRICAGAKNPGASSQYHWHIRHDSMHTPYQDGPVIGGEGKK